MTLTTTTTTTTTVDNGRSEIIWTRKEIEKTLCAYPTQNKRKKERKTHDQPTTVSTQITDCAAVTHFKGLCIRVGHSPSGHITNHHFECESASVHIGNKPINCFTINSMYALWCCHLFACLPFELQFQRAQCSMFIIPSVNWCIKISKWKFHDSFVVSEYMFVRPQILMPLGIGE